MRRHRSGRGEQAQLRALLYVAALACGTATAVAACSLNPQPIPPGAVADEDGGATATNAPSPPERAEDGAGGADGSVRTPTGAGQTAVDGGDAAVPDAGDAGGPDGGADAGPDPRDAGADSA